MLRIELLPAAHGDCLWIEYGSGSEEGRILIDGGPWHTYPALHERVARLPAAQRRFDLLVVTHIDADHIEGVVRLLQDAGTLGCRFDRIWFNGWKQLNDVPDPAGAPLGAAQGEYLSLLISDYEERTGRTVWNAGFPTPYVGLERGSALPVVDLPGDSRLTLLSPDLSRLLALKDRWDDELRLARVDRGDEPALRARLAAAGQLRPLGDVLGAGDDLAGDRFEIPDPDGRDAPDALPDALGGGSGEPGDDVAFGGDDSEANGSSIAFLLDHPGKDPKVRLLLSGDAWAPVLEASIASLTRTAGDRLALDAFKISHHGSAANLSEALLGRLACDHYLVSTSGARFRHPHSRAIELLLQAHRGRAIPRLHFNYLTETTSRWSDKADQAARRYEAFHSRGISLEIP